MNTKFFGLSDTGFYSNLKNFILYTSFLPFFAGLIAFVCWFNNLTLLGLAIFVAVACYIFISQKDLTPIIPLLLCVIMLFRDFSITGNWHMYAILSPALVSIIIHMIRFKDKIKFGTMFLPLCTVSLALALGGLNSFYMNDYLGGLASVISLGPGLLIVYMFFNNYVHTPKQACLKQYYSKTVMWMTFFACLEMFVVIVNQRFIHSPNFNVNELGWANVNCVATLIIITIPLCFYMMVKSQQVAKWFVVAGVFCGFLLLSGSSGALLSFVLYVPFLAVYTFYSMDRTKQMSCRNVFFTVFLIALFAVTLIAVYDFSIIISLVEKALSANGRYVLYDEAISLFVKNPVFGVGLGYYNDLFPTLIGNIRAYNFHSTFYNVIATMGIVGLTAYAYYFASRIYVFTVKDCRFSKIAFITLMIFSTYGMIDTCEFNMIPLSIIIILLCLVAEIDSKKHKMFERFQPTYSKFTD